MDIENLCCQSKGRDKYVLVWFEWDDPLEDQRTVYEEIEAVYDGQQLVGYLLKTLGDIEFYRKDKISHFVIRNKI